MTSPPSTITREYMLIYGFETHKSLAAIEVWADGVEELSRTAAM